MRQPFQVWYRTAMQTTLTQSTLPRHEIETAENALRKCVHCGFCNATCPTYQILGNELDGPRGRIYLIKQSLEGQAISTKTQSHLDRCLTCRACETTCPSGVPYAELLEIGRNKIATEIKRPLSDRLMRYMLKKVLPYPRRLQPLLRLSPWLTWLLPAAAKKTVKELPHLTENRPNPDSQPPQPSDRKMLLLQGCAQETIRPDINASTLRVLGKLGIQAEVISGSGCCGAVTQHLNAPEEAKQFMRRNIDSWWPAIEAGAEAIITTASACTLMTKDYGRLLADDPEYSNKAAKVSALTLDASEVIANEELSSLAIDASHPVAVQIPCTAQHGQSLSAALLKILAAAGLNIINTSDKQMCCGAAGTYTVFQPDLSQSLRQQRLEVLQQDKPDYIVTANIGCLLHLQHKANVPVLHWVEVLDRHWT